MVKMLWVSSLMNLIDIEEKQTLGKCYVFLSVDEKTEVQIIERGAGGWEIIYMPTEPEDLAHIIPGFG